MLAAVIATMIGYHATFVCPHVPPGAVPCRQWVLRTYGEWRDT